MTVGLLEWPNISLENIGLKSLWEPHSSPPGELACVEGMSSLGLLFSFEGHIRTLAGALPVLGQPAFPPRYLTVPKISGLVDGVVGSRGGCFSVL